MKERDDLREDVLASLGLGPSETKVTLLNATIRSSNFQRHPEAFPNARGRGTSGIADLGFGDGRREGSNRSW